MGGSFSAASVPLMELRGCAVATVRETERLCLYFKEAPTSLNSLLSAVPRTCKEPMINTAINEAIKAYSIAVAPRESPRNCLIDLRMTIPSATAWIH